MGMVEMIEQTYHNDENKPHGDLCYFVFAPVDSTLPSPVNILPAPICAPDPGQFFVIPLERWVGPLRALVERIVRTSFACRCWTRY